MHYTKLKLGYFADGPWAHKALERIFADASLQVLFVCIRYDNPDQHLRQMARERGIDCFCHPNINSDEFLKAVQNYPCDLHVSMSFNQIFRQRILDIPPLHTINCHAGKLPFYRGHNILNWVLINDEKEFGITVHYIDEGIDTGDIICQRTYPITDEDNYRTLLERSHTSCAEILYDALKLIQQGEVVRQVQTEIHPVGMYCSQRKIGDEILDWNQTSRDVFNFVRAICGPGPMARSFVDGQEVKINHVRLVADAPSYKGVIGAIIGKKDDGLYVKTQDSFIYITDYYSEKKLKVGDRFESIRK